MKNKKKIYVRDSWPEDGVFYVQIWSNLTVKPTLVGYEKYVKRTNGRWSHVVANLSRGQSLKEEIYPEYMDWQEYDGILKSIEH